LADPWNELEIALGLPKLQLYRDYTEKLKWFIRNIELYIYFVNEKGKVSKLNP